MTASPQTPPPSDPHQLAGNLWKLNLIRALFWTHFISSVLIPFYRDWGGLTLQMILAVNAWFMIWNFLLEIPTGTVADVWGRKASLALGCLLGIVAALIYISAPSLSRFLLAEVLFAASFTLMSGADEALLYDTLLALNRSAEADRRYARLATFQQIGIVTGALLGSVIFYYLGPRAPLGLQTVPMAIAGLVTLTLVEPKRSEHQRRPTYRRVLSVGVKTFLGSGPLLRLTAHMTIFSATAWMIIWLYQPLIERAGMPLLYFGLVHTGLSLGQILFFSQCHRLENLLGSRRRLLLFGPAIAGLGFLALALTRDLVWVVVLVILVAAFGLTRPALFTGQLNRHIEDSGHRATVLSTVAMFRTATIALGNLVIGAMTRVSLDATLLVLAAATLLLFVLPLRESDLEPE